MGIKGLWGVLTPFSEKKSLHEIRGETIAVDLSGWVCDSQNVAEYHIQPKLYLRNLFFRTIYLLLAEINPIFVLEGDAPELKRDVMAARNAIQFRGAAPRTDTGNKKQPDVARRRFKGVLKECESLLKCMGVRCIKGQGEAEAMCAKLNEQGACVYYNIAIMLKQLVDAVVSQDSDCFAYGARRVYRNFSVSNAAGGGAMQGSVDCYDTDKMFSCNGFGRNKMVALALLCGCDYGVGACGSSIGTAVAFLHTIGDDDIIPRLISWVSDPDRYEERARWAAAPGRCDRCGHVGRTHLKNGCPVCATHKGCTDLGHKSKVSEVKRELSLRSRALSCGMPFPEPKVMKEFLNTSTEIIDINSLPTAPSLIQFVKLMSYKLDWSERYCVEKFLPVLTKWHLQDKVPHRTIKPVVIKKKRNPRGVPSYEVVWEDIDGLYDGLIPDDQYEDDEDPSIAWTSIERQDLMRQYYTELVEKYEESIKKPVKEKKPKGRKKKDCDNPDKPKRKYNKKIKDLVDRVNESLKVCELNTSKANVSVNVNKLKRKIKSNSKKGVQKSIDSFIASKKLKSSKKSMQSLRRSFKNMSVVYNDYYNSNDQLFDEKENQVMIVDRDRHLLSMLDSTEGDVDESELSNIIEKMLNRPPVTKTAMINNKLNKLVFTKNSTPKKNVRKSILSEKQNYCSTPIDSPIQRKRFSFNIGAHSFNNSIAAKANTSYFFDKLTEEGDAFEMSLEHKSAVINIDCNTTVEYSLPEVCL